MKLEKFAKIIDIEIGQVLIVKDNDTEEDEPCIKIMFQPEGLGVCSFTATYEDEETRDEAYLAVRADAVQKSIENALGGLL